VPVFGWIAVLATTSCIAVFIAVTSAEFLSAFAASIAADDSPHLIIETHSNHVVSRFGQLISEGKLKHSDVQILIFDKNGSAGKSNITKSWFDEEGYLLNWPIGFFEPEM